MSNIYHKTHPAVSISPKMGALDETVNLKTIILAKSLGYFSPNNDRKYLG